jgi:hypothetical protein
MKTINTLLLAGSLGLGTVCQAALTTPSASGAAGTGAGVNGANSLWADQNNSKNFAMLNSSINGQAWSNVTLPRHGEFQDVITTTAQSERQQYEAQQKQLLAQLQTTTGEQRDAIREQLKHNRKAYQAYNKQLRQELRDGAKQLQASARTDVDVQVDRAK